MSIVKLATNAFTRNFLDNKLSKNALNKIRKSGILRSENQIIDGINRGSQKLIGNNKIIKDNLTTEQKLMALTNGGYYQKNNEIVTLSNSKLKYLSPLHKFFNRSENKINDALAIRHEAYEYNESKKGLIANIYKKRNTKWYDKYNPDNIKIIDNNESLQRVGLHNNLSVLGKESNDVKRFSIYKDIDNLKDLRNNTGENILLKRITGKNYGDSFLSKKDLKKLKNANYDLKENYDGNDTMMLLNGKFPHRRGYIITK